MPSFLPTASRLFSTSGPGSITAGFFGISLPAADVATEIFGGFVIVLQLLRVCSDYARSHGKPLAREFVTSPCRVLSLSRRLTQDKRPLAG
jgi:hypothetical protein